MRIGIDISGGDFGIKNRVLGTIIFGRLNPDVEISLIGDKKEISKHLDYNHPDNFKIIHSSNDITMSESPSVVMSTDRENSSISIGLRLLKNGMIDGFCSVGNTGAIVMGGLTTLNTLEGVSRTPIISQIPKHSGHNGVLLDIGANINCKPEVLNEFGTMGSSYAKNIMGVINPKVGLMNIGEEEGKGGVVIKESFELLKNNTKINFIGNVEGNDLFNNKVDVIVCDGFTGNVLIKVIESFKDILNFDNSFYDKLNYESMGGCPILGLKGNVVVGHGKSSTIAISSMLKSTYNLIKHSK